MKKKLLSFLLALVLCVGVFPATASAAEDNATQAAQTLYELGLFKGTGTNPDGTPIFDLDKTPTRNQALIMLIRLLGKEEEALSISWGSIPFTDVPETMRLYVAYAYANGLTMGYTATMFNGAASITANQYISFVLRALGYETGRDFEVSAACAFSDALGLTHGEYGSGGTFTRGDVAKLSVTALDTEKKDSDETLLETLKAPEPKPQKTHHRDDDDDVDWTPAPSPTPTPTPTPTPSEPQSTITLTNGKPVDEPRALVYNSESRPLEGEIHSWTAQRLDNGYVRFTMEYTVPAGLSISVFDPTNSDIMMQMDTTGTTGEKSTLQFDVSNEALAQMEELTVKFQTDDSNRFSVFFKLEDNNNIRALASAAYFGLPADIQWIDAPTDMDDLDNNILYSFLLGNYSLNFTNLADELLSDENFGPRVIQKSIKALGRKYPELVGVFCNTFVGCGVHSDKTFIDFPKSTDLSLETLYEQQRTALTTAIGIKNALHKDGTITDGMTELQIAQAYYDYLRGLNVAVGGGSEAAHNGESWKYDTPYACLVNKAADCVGRAGAFNLLMHHEGIAAEGVAGQIKDTDSGHVLSRVTLDGQTYYCDWGNNRPLSTDISDWFTFD